MDSYLRNYKNTKCTIQWNLLGKRRQLATGKTIHKDRGTTLQNEVTNMGKLHILDLTLTLTPDKDALLLSAYICHPILPSHVQEILESLFGSDLLEKPHNIIEDFNIDAQSTEHIQSFMFENFGLRKLPTGGTTDYSSVINQIYTNIPLDQLIYWGTLETYYYDLKLINISFKKKIMFSIF